MSKKQQKESKLIEGLLWSKEKKSQVVLATIGAFIGLSLFLFSFQTYLDLHQFLNTQQTGSEDFVTINKPVNLLNTLGIKSGFSEKEIKELEAQPLINHVGKFTANQFKVSASSSDFGFYTELFLEAVPDLYVDVKSTPWDWEVDQEEVPILLSRDYLALYNFGFAPSQGLPQFTPGTIKLVTFDLTVSGNQKSSKFKGRIVGFSDRINSILVPQSFMEWANSQFGTTSTKRSSRLVISTNQSEDKQFSKFLEDKGYELSGNKLLGSKLGTILNGMLSGIGLTGLLIFLLSLLVFVLSFKLIIARSKEDLHRLIQIGYQPDFLVGLFSKKLFSISIFLGLSTTLFLIIAKYSISYWLETYSVTIPRFVRWQALIAILIFCFIFYFVNINSIRKLSTE